MDRLFHRRQACLTALLLLMHVGCCLIHVASSSRSTDGKRLNYLPPVSSGNALTEAVCASACPYNLNMMRISLVRAFKVFFGFDSKQSGRKSRGTAMTPPIDPALKDDDLMVDLRAHKLFLSNPRLDCCPTVTQINRRSVGINPHGLVLQLFQTENFTQAFYETICDPQLKDRPCQFISTDLAPYSRCVQQWSYVYAMGRTFGQFYEQFRFDYIRVATGCKCQLPAHVVRQRAERKQLQQQQQQPPPSSSSATGQQQRQSVFLLQPSNEDGAP